VWWCDVIREMSDGRLDITPYPAGELVPSVEIPDCLAAGVIEASYSCGAYYTGILPSLGLEPNGLPPFMWYSIEDAFELFVFGGLEDLVREAYAELDVHLLNLPLCDNCTIWSKYPLGGVEDLQGFKVRLWSGYVADTFTKLGAAPVFLPHEETYTALATGVIDGSGTGEPQYITMKLYEQCPYIYQPSMLNPASMDLLTSASAWDELPADIKTIVEVASTGLRTKFYFEGCDLVTKEVFSAVGMAEKGITPIQWSTSDLKVMAEAGLSCLPDLAAKSPRCAEGVRIIEEWMKFKGYVD